MNFSHNDINKKALYVLREDSNGQFHTEYLPIQIDENLSNSIKKLQEKMQEKIKNEKLSRQEIYNIKTQMILEYWEDIQKNHSYLLGYRDYCNNITGSYVSSPGISTNFKMEFLPFSPDSDNVRIKKSENDSTMIQYIFSDDFFKSYFIEEAYNECKTDNNIKAYSHRRIGHTTYHFELNNIFSIRIKTNFGYGYANHFLVTLIYDGIQIIPYSRLVVYYKANYMELIRNTWDFYISDDSWELAFDMVRDACNNYQQGGVNNFINRYFTDELEKLTSKLREYLNVNEFELSENEYGYCIDRNKKTKTVQLNGFPLTIFRGEKIVGAVGFLDSIKKINKILPTQKYIDIIVDCCEKILPQFDRALNELNSIIEKLESIYKQECKERERLETRFKEIEPEMEMYNESEKAIQDEIYESTKDDKNVDYQKRTNLVVDEMRKKYPDWEKTKETYSNRKKEFKDQETKCSEISSNLYTHKSYFSTISKYKENIESFIENQTND